MKKTAGTAISLGSLMFMAAALSPAVLAHWSTPYSLVPESYKAGWLLGYRMFAAGAVITAIGFAVLGAHLRRQSGDRLVRLLSYAADVFIVAGSICWILSLDESIFLPFKVRFPASPAYSWFSLYFNLSLVSFFIYGYLLLRAGSNRWLAWGTIGFYALLLGVYLYLGDLPPAVLYLWPIVLGIGLLARVVRRADDN